MKKKSIIIDGEKVFVQEEQILRFQNEIEELVKTGGLNYLESVTHYCKIHDIEVESIINLISPVLYQKLEDEARDLNLIKVATRTLFDV